MLIRTLEVGVCATDRKISAGLFGAAPDAERRLVLGVKAKPSPAFAEGQ